MQECWLGVDLEQKARVEGDTTPGWWGMGWGSCEKWQLGEMKQMWVMGIGCEFLENPANKGMLVGGGS